MNKPFLESEEYVEQAYFFRAYRERLEESIPSQEILASIHEEVLASTKLPMALEFLAGEIVLTGRISDGMAHLSHYFTPFQTFILSKAEEDKSRFDQYIALRILEHEAEYRLADPTPQGLFIFQFECISRNKLGYDYGLAAVADDPMYDSNWREWILKIHRQLGAADFADLIYIRSDYAVEERRRTTKDPGYQADFPVLFSAKEGRIAKANRRKDPLFMFAALQRQLGYPEVPKAKPRSEGLDLHPELEVRLQQIEKKIQLLEMDAKGGIDLKQFYANPPNFQSGEENQPE